MKKHAPAVAMLILGALALAVSLVDGGAAGGPARASGESSDFRLSTPAGETVSLSDFVGKKPVLLAFWATWCPQCKEAIPRLSGMETGPMREKVKIFAVDYLERPDKVEAFVKARKIPYTVLLDRDGKVSRSYGIPGVPTYILIGLDGRVAWRDHELPADFEKLLR